MLRGFVEADRLLRHDGNVSPIPSGKWQMTGIRCCWCLAGGCPSNPDDGAKRRGFGAELCDASMLGTKNESGIESSQVLDL